MRFTLPTGGELQNRWARTPKFEAEQAAGKPLPMSFVTDPETGAIQSDRRNGLANTHIIWHGDQLLALEEGSHPFPWRLTRWRRWLWPLWRRPSGCYDGAPED